MLRRRLRVEHIRELRFQFLQPVHFEIEILVGESRAVEHVVLVVRFFQLLAERFQFFAFGFFYLAE